MQVENQNEAIVSVLVASVHIDDELTDFECEKIASILVYCDKFRNLEIIEFIRKSLLMKMEYRPSHRHTNQLEQIIADSRFPTKGSRYNTNS